MNSFDWKRAVKARVVAALVAVGRPVRSRSRSTPRARAACSLVVIALALFAAGLYVYVSRAALAWRYLVPGRPDRHAAVRRRSRWLYTMCHRLHELQRRRTCCRSSAGTREGLPARTDACPGDGTLSIEFTLHPDWATQQHAAARARAVRSGHRYAQRFHLAARLTPLKGDKAETSTMPPPLPADAGARRPALSSPRDVPDASRRA